MNAFRAFSVVGVFYFKEKDMCKSAAKSIAAIANPIVAGTTGLLAGGLAGGGGSMPGVPNPAYLQQTPVPGMTPQELQTLQKMGVNLDQLNAILSGEQGNLAQNQDLLKQFSGLYGADGKLDQAAVDALKQRITGTQTQLNQLNDAAYNQLIGSFNPSQLETTSDQIGLQEAQRLQDAIAGNLAPSNAIVNQEKKEFEKLKEAAGQRGIKLEGNDLYSATSQSTAGNQLLNDLRSNFAARRDTERQNIINQATSANMNRLGFGLDRQNQLYNQAQGVRTDPSQSTLGFMRESQSYSPANLTDYYANLNNQYLAYANPYANQRMTEYQGALNNAQYNNQLQNAQITGNYNSALQNYQNQQNRQNAIFGTIGTIGGGLVGGYFGGPAGAMIGSQAGNQLLGRQQANAAVMPNYGMGFSQPRATTQVMPSNYGYQPYSNVG